MLVNLLNLSFALSCSGSIGCQSCQKILTWTAKETCHFCQRPHVKIQTIKITNVCTQVCCNTLLLITCQKASDYLHDKEEIGMNSNLVTESKFTECNRMSLTICTQKSVSQARQQELAGLHQMSFPEHVSEMPEMCPDTRGALHIIEKK